MNFHMNFNYSLNSNHDYILFIYFFWLTKTSNCCFYLFALLDEMKAEVIKISRPSSFLFFTFIIKAKTGIFKVIQGKLF